MKKILFAIAALATSMAASAQVWVGGVVGFENESFYTEGSNSYTSWRIEPTVGYALSDNLEVGLGFGVSGTKQGDTKSTKFNIQPFVRYTFFSAGDFSMFADGKVGYNYSKYGDADGTWDFGINIKPGIKYQLTENFSIVGQLYGDGLYFKQYKEPETKTGTKNQFGLECGTGLSFGLYYTF